MCGNRSFLDLTEESLKALASPSRRPAGVLQHLERQAAAIKEMQDLIQKQILRLKVEERFMKKKLSTVPIPDNEPEPTPQVESMEVDVIPTSTTSSTTNEPLAKQNKLLVPISDSEEDEEDEWQEEDLPPSLRRGANGLYGQYDDEYDDDDDENDAMSEVRRILASQRGV